MCFWAPVYQHVLGHWSLGGPLGLTWTTGSFLLGSSLPSLHQLQDVNSGDVAPFKVPGKEAPEIKAVGV